MLQRYCRRAAVITEIEFEITLKLHIYMHLFIYIRSELNLETRGG